MAQSQGTKDPATPANDSFLSPGNNLSMVALEGDDGQTTQDVHGLGGEDEGLLRLCQKISSLDPVQRQVIKHHLLEYETHDYRQLLAQSERSQRKQELHQMEASMEEAWKDKMREELEKHPVNLSEHQKYESLNYGGADDHLLHREHNMQRAAESKLQYRVIQWSLFCMIGCSAGITGYAVKRGEEFIGHWRLLKVEEYAADNMNNAWWVQLGISLLFMTVAVALTHLCPQAAGSGVPDVKASLNGVRVPHILSWRVFVVKILGLILAVATGLALGPEGPMIHACAILGGGISQGLLSWPVRIALPCMRGFRNDTAKRDAISAGAAAGVAAAFGAPIGGLLFSMEEASSFWSSSQTWRTMITCLFGTFSMSLLVHGGESFNDPGLVHFGVGEKVPTKYAIWELLAWVPIGLGGGLVGALFNSLAVSKIAFVGRVRARFKKWGKSMGMGEKVPFVIITMLEAWLTVAIYQLICFELTFEGDCLPVPKDSKRNNDTTTRAMHFLPWDCERGSVVDLDELGTNSDLYNDMASLTLLPQLEVIRALLSRETLDDGSVGLFTARSLGFYFPIYFLLVVLCTGLLVPQGLFVPQIVIGALGGRLYGMAVHSWISSDAIPGTYGLMGASAMLAGSTRITISLAVIMFEITNDLQYLVPIMLVIVLAKNVGSLFNEPYYDELIELRHIPVLEEEAPELMELFHVGEIMHCDPVCVQRFCKLSELARVVRDTNHSCFPVIREQQDKTMIGSLSKETAMVLLHRYETERKDTYNETDRNGGVAFDTLCPESESPPPLSYEEFREIEDYMRTSKHKIDFDNAIWSDIDGLVIDLLPYVNLSSMIVAPTFSLHQCFSLFRNMALRHVVVVNTAHAPIGILTREELQKHYLYVWLDREKSRQHRQLTSASLKSMRKPSKSNLFHDIHNGSPIKNNSMGHAPPNGDGDAAINFYPVNRNASQSLHERIESELNHNYMGDVSFHDPEVRKRIRRMSQLSRRASMTSVPGVAPTDVEMEPLSAITQVEENGRHDST